MTNSNKNINNEKAIHNKNRQLTINASTPVKVAITECNYSDNYYGDQLCKPVENTRATNQAANNNNITQDDVSFNNVTNINTSKITDCNYNNNYYGDQLCKPVGVIRTHTLNNQEKNTKHTSCNYNNNYYGDQLCKAVAS